MFEYLKDKKQKEMTEMGFTEVKKEDVKPKEIENKKEEK